MPTPLLSPNLHVILIHYPLGLLVAGTMIELFAFLWPTSSFRSAGRWMILIGALSAIPAAYSGIYALRDISRMEMEQPWLRFKIDSPVFSNPIIWKMLWRHTLFQSIAAGVSALVVTVWLGCSDRSRLLIRWPALLLLLGAVGLIGYGAWFGGESIYRHGVAVEPVFPVVTETDPPSIHPATWTTKPTKAELMFPPLELHVVMAGVCTSFALAAVGLSFRKLTTLYVPPNDRPVTVTEQRMAPATPRDPPSAVAMARSLNPGVQIDLHFSAPAGRFWMITFLIAFLTAVGGVFVLSRGASIPLDLIKHPKSFAGTYWDVVRPDGHPIDGLVKDMKTHFSFSKMGHDIKGAANRLTSHLVFGSTIVALPLLLALISRFSPRRRVLLSVFTGLLIFAIGFQVWLGVLLLFDTSAGPLLHYTTATESGK